VQGGGELIWENEAQAELELIFLKGIYIGPIRL